MADKDQATFTVVLDNKVSAPAKDAADAVNKLRESITAGTERLRDMQAAERRLVGSTDAIKKAKDELKKRIAAEKDAISASSHALVEHGAALNKTRDEVEKLKEAKRKQEEATKRAEGQLSKYLSTVNAVALGAAAAGVAVLGAAAAFGKLVLGQANAERTAGLFREAAIGNADDAARLGNQIDLLATKVPTSRAAINDLAIDLSKAGLSGYTLVDSLNAITQESAALGDTAGNKIREFIERGKLSKRFQINPAELLQGNGTGLKFDDVATALSDNMGISIQKAREALAQGRVTLGAGAQALNTAIRSKFGDVNLRRMLDIGVMFEKAKEKFDKFTKGIKLEPLLKGFQELEKMLDESSVTGAAVKSIIEFIGNELVTGIKAAIPIAKEFFTGLLIGATEAQIAYLELRLKLKDVFGSDILADQAKLNQALEVGKVLAIAMAVAFGTVAAVLYAGYKSAELLYNLLIKWPKGIGTDIADWIKGGKHVNEGIAEGVNGGPARDAIKKLGEDMKGDFKFSLGIASPSKVFAKYGEHVAEGFEKGVNAGAPDATQALDNMVTKPANPGGTMTKGNTTTVSIPITMTGAPAGGSDAQDNQAFLAQLTKALEDALIAAGIPAVVS